MTRQRLVLIAVGIVALAMILSPAILFRIVQPTLCPTVIVSEGRIQGGVNYEFTRSDCDSGRIVWQVRVAPPQGVLRLAYDAEGGPEPASIEQLGRMLTIRLRAPLADGATSVQVELDHRARPKEAARIRGATLLPPVDTPRGRNS